MRTILHITPHMGGGVGKALSGIASYEAEHGSGWQHRILLLEPPEKENFLAICCAKGVDVHVARDMEEIRREMQSADIVQIEWWHHPLMADFLARFPRIRTRIVIWSHISGCYYPFLPFALLQIPEAFLFTSPYSLENPFWTEKERSWGEENTDVVYIVNDINFCT